MKPPAPAAVGGYKRGTPKTTRSHVSCSWKLRVQVQLGEHPPSYTAGMANPSRQRDAKGKGKPEGGWGVGRPALMYRRTCALHSPTVR